MESRSEEIFPAYWCAGKLTLRNSISLYPVIFGSLLTNALKLGEIDKKIFKFSKLFSKEEVLGLCRPNTRDLLALSKRSAQFHQFLKLSFDT
jgi:hypothetical protein